MVFDDFASKIKSTYPVLYNYDERLDDIIIDGVSVSEFIDKHQIPSNKESYTSYEDVWNYIVANEHLHDWWML